MIINKTHSYPLNKANLFSEFITITPEYAKQLLEKNVGNRKISHQTVERYASLFQKGLWDILNGESIKFNTKGNLVDGQHRLLAIIKANKPMPFLILRNVSEDARLTINTGKTVTNGNLFSALHYNYFTERGSWTNSIFYLLSSRAAKSDFVTLRLYHDYFIEEIEYLLRFRSKNKSKKLLVAPIAGSFILLLKVYGTVAYQAFEDYFERTPNNSFNYLYDIALSNTKNSNGSKRLEYFSNLTFAAFDYYIKKINPKFIKDTPTAKKSFLHEHRENIVNEAYLMSNKGVN